MTMERPVPAPDPCALGRALATIGHHPSLRAKVVAACLELERQPEFRRTRVRDEITGPIVDALFSPSDIARKELGNGLVFEFLYRSRIARDFVMSVPERPDHVWEPQTTRLLLHLGAGARHAIVGGAYFGDQAILLADRLRATGGICHAFEADPDQREMLARNAAANHLNNITISGSALWCADGARLRFVGEDAYGSTTAIEEDAVGGVPAIRLDSYLDEHGIDDIQMVALDVEGSELAILRGAAQRLSRPPGRAPHVVFEVHRSYVDWSNGLLRTDICEYLASIGYTMFAIRDFQTNYDMGGRPIELVPANVVHLDGPPHGFNVVATKTPEVLGGDCFRVCPGVSPKFLLHGDPALHHPLDGLP